MDNKTILIISILIVLGYVFFTKTIVRQSEKLIQDYFKRTSVENILNNR